jgi:predicted Zn-dependent peptidase
MTIYSGTSGDKVAELANITMDELKRAADDMSEAEVARARAQMKAGLLMGLESPSSRAERLARMMTIWDRIPSLNEVVSQIDGVTTEAVRNFSGLMAGGAPAAMALYGPVADAPTIEKLQARLVA